MTMNSLQIRGDRDLARLDRKHSLAAIYHVPTGSTVSDIGEVSIVYTEVPVRVRPAGLSSYEISRFSQSGIGKIDAIWMLRKTYVKDVEPDHIIEVSGFFYQVIDGGATLDQLELLWTILTRRRR